MRGKRKKLQRHFQFQIILLVLERVAQLLIDKEIGVISDPSDIKAVGHRVVHGAEAFTKTVVITEEVKSKSKRIVPIGTTT